MQNFEVNLAKEIRVEVNYGLKCFQFYKKKELLNAC
jgi:hypothetical protein